MAKYNNREAVIHAVKYQYSNDCIGHRDIEVEALNDFLQPNVWACKVTQEEYSLEKVFYVLVDSDLIDPSHSAYRDPRNGGCPSLAFAETQFTSWPPRRRRE